MPASWPQLRVRSCISYNNITPTGLNNPTPKRDIIIGYGVQADFMFYNKYAPLGSGE
jgi:hypothetical protein